MGEPIRRIRSFSLRGARLGDKYEELMREHAKRFVIDIPAGDGVSTIAPDARIDLAAEFGRQAPLIVEVGPGSGEQLTASALTHPECNYLGLEAWAPGVARCVKSAVTAGVDNVRIMQLDAAQGLPVLFSAARSGSSINPPAAQVWTFFPDPWRKRKHRKRRIVSPEFAHIVAGVLADGGVWRLATDWENYAWQMRDVLVESPWFDLDDSGINGAHDSINDGVDDLGIYSGGWASRWSERVTTRFEERGIEAGRHVYDLTAVRNSLAVDAVPIPEDPWVAARERGEDVRADQPGVTPQASSRSGWLKEQEARAASSRSSVSLCDHVHTQEVSIDD